MRIVIRVDSSVQIGSGHVMRCLTLARKLETKGAQVSFVCRELAGNMNEFISEQGFSVKRLVEPTIEIMPASTDIMHASWLGVAWQHDVEETRLALAAEKELPDWLVIDHYSLDKRWEDLLRTSVRHIMTIDDLADRHHNCDLLLDQNYYLDGEGRYSDLVPEHCRLLVGPRYALLRDEFADGVRWRDGSVNRILIFFGGSDVLRQTERALSVIRSLGRPDIACDVVVGSMNERQKQVRELCASIPNCRYYCQTGDMAQLMAAADVFVGAGGGSNWERCALGLPSIVVSIAHNQNRGCEDLGVAGAISFLGLARDVDDESMAAALSEWLHDFAKVREVGLRAAQIADARGAELVVEAMLAVN